MHLNNLSGIYSALSIGEGFVMIVRDVLFYMRCAIAAKLIHEALLKGVMKSPMQFFDTNPLGRIINRFSSDMFQFYLFDISWCDVAG